MSWEDNLKTEGKTMLRPHGGKPACLFANFSHQN